MYNPYRRGTPDMWYSGYRGDLWLEWKWIPRTPKSRHIKPKLSPDQLRWLKGRQEEGRAVGVVVGFPDGNLMSLDRFDLISAKPVLSNREVADAILDFVT